MSIPLCGCYGNQAQCTELSTLITPDEEKCSSINIPNISELTAIWDTIPCVTVYSDILNTAPDGTRGYNPSNLARIQTDINTLMTNYQTEYDLQFTSDTSSPKYNSFQEQLFGLCSSRLVPGGCDLFLTNYCSQYTREQIEKDKALATLCGCYAPPQFSTTTIPPRCDPICHLEGTAQLSDPCTGIVKSCSNTVCVINDVNISLVDTNTSIAFTQICPACSNTDPCTCIISGINIVDTLNKSGAGVTYKQYCGTNAQCFQENPATGVLTNVGCPTGTDFGGGGTSILWLAIFIFVVLGIFIMTMVYASRRDSWKAISRTYQK